MNEHKPYFKEIFMLSMCPLVVFMIFAAKNMKIFHYFEQKSV